MVQRLGIAQALLCDPQLVIMDEPTSGLDPAGRREVLQLLVSLKAEGKTVFLSSHILPEVEQICDRVVIIDHGKLIRTGRLSDMLGSGTAVEIVVDSLSQEMESAMMQRGGVVQRTPQGIKVTTDLSRKRELAEALWSGGCDVVSLNPVRSTLEEAFLETVDGKDAK